MYAIFGVINVKPEHVRAFKEATIREARGTVRDEPGVVVLVSPRRPPRAPPQFRRHPIVT